MRTRLALLGSLAAALLTVSSAHAVEFDKVENVKDPVKASMKK